MLDHWQQRFIHTTIKSRCPRLHHAVLGLDSKDTSCPFAVWWKDETIKPRWSLPCIALHHTTRYKELCHRYPEGNFDRNQLQNGSMSLSPLYSYPINDLHVSNTASLHPKFIGLRCAQVKVTTFRVRTQIAFTQNHINLTEELVTTSGCPKTNLHGFFGHPANFDHRVCATLAHHWFHLSLP